MVQLLRRLWSDEQGQDIAEYAVMLAVILVLVIYTITQGGPGISSETLYLYSYNVGFSFFKAGYGSALMVVVFLIVLVFNVVMNRLRLSAQDL